MRLTSQFAGPFAAFLGAPLPPFLPLTRELQGFLFAPKAVPSPEAFGAVVGSELFFVFFTVLLGSPSLTGLFPLFALALSLGLLGAFEGFPCEKGLGIGTSFLPLVS